MLWHFESVKLSIYLFICLLYLQQMFSIFLKFPDGTAQHRGGEHTTPTVPTKGLLSRAFQPYLPQPSLVSPHYSDYNTVRDKYYVILLNGFSFDL